MTAGVRFRPEDDELFQRLLAILGEEAREELLMAARQLMEEGRKEGLKEGIKRGQQQTLRRLLQARFGALPDAALARLFAADSPELDLWTDRILTAPTLVDVLGAT